jgi:hypothetical protein
MAVLLLLVFCCLALCLQVESLGFDEAAIVIKEHLSARKHSSSDDYCNANPTLCCELSDSQDGCSVSNMPQDVSTLVFPGGETRCIFSTSSPFNFQVIPGKSDKLLIYFQGGGACWDKLSTALTFCTTDADPDFSGAGIFSRDESNEYKDYTIVHALYCDGSVWTGDTVRPYKDSNGEFVTQKGLANAQSVLDWVKQQQTLGSLASTFSNLVIMGCSAGSIGAQVWSSPILETLSWTQAAVIPDSYIAVFPDGTQGPLIQGFGACDAWFLDDKLKRICRDGKLTLQLIMTDYFPQYKSIPFAYIQSKVDIIQQSFYVAVAFTSNVSAVITPTQFYDDVNQIMSLYNKESNFLTYLVDGDQHCFTPNSYYFTADPLGRLDKQQNTDSPLMSTWTSSFPLTDGQTASTICDGAVEGTAEINNKNTYCSSQVYPKSFQESY